MEEILVKILNYVVDAVSERLEHKLSGNTTQTTPKYYSRQDVCKLLHITPPTLLKYSNQGRLKAHKIDRRVLYDATEIDNAVKYGVKKK